MKVSNCCGDSGLRRWYFSDTQYIDHNVCGECEEPCEYIEEDNDVRDMMKQIYTNYPNRDYLSQSYRDYNGQIKKQDD